MCCLYYYMRIDINDFLLLFGCNVIFPSIFHIYLYNHLPITHIYLSIFNLSSLGTYLFEQAANGEETTTINSFRDALNHFIISKDLKK